MKTKGRKCALIKGRCPRSSDECPMWWSTVHENTKTGETQVLEECGFAQLPLYLTEVIRASNRPAAEVGAIRYELGAGLRRVARVMGELPRTVRLEN